MVRGQAGDPRRGPLQSGLAWAYTSLADPCSQATKKRSGYSNGQHLTIWPGRLTKDQKDTYGGSGLNQLLVLALVLALLPPTFSK